MFWLPFFVQLLNQCQYLIWWPEQNKELAVLMRSLYVGTTLKQRATKKESEYMQNLNKRHTSVCLRVNWCDEIKFQQYANANYCSRSRFGWSLVISAWCFICLRFAERESALATTIRFIYYFKMFAWRFNEERMLHNTEKSGRIHSEKRTQCQQQQQIKQGALGFETKITYIIEAAFDVGCCYNRCGSRSRITNVSSSAN